MFPFALSQNEYAWNLLELVTLDQQDLCLLRDGDALYWEYRNLLGQPQNFQDQILP